MNTLLTHVVEGDSANHQLRITVADEPGQGSACHRYEVTGYDTQDNPAAYGHAYDALTVIFQNGPIKEVGVNGVTHEALLAILIHRLECFQNGPFASKHNKAALQCGKDMLFHLQTRTRERIERGVEGTHQK